MHEVSIFPTLQILCTMEIWKVKIKPNKGKQGAIETYSVQQAIMQLNRGEYVQKKILMQSQKIAKILL